MSTIVSHVALLRQFLADRLGRAYATSRPSVRLSVTKVDPGQTAERIEMKLGTDVCPGQSSIVLDGDLSPPTGRGQMGGEV